MRNEYLLYPQMSAALQVQPITTSQQIAFDPSAFVGFSDEQLALIRQGFMAALSEVYSSEADHRQPLEG